MGAKRNKPGTPSKPPSQQNLASAWKRNNSSNTPVRLLPSSQSAKDPYKLGPNKLLNRVEANNLQSGKANSFTTSEKTEAFASSKSGEDILSESYSSSSDNSSNSSGNSSSTEKMENLKGEKASIHLESLTEFPLLGDITSPPKPKNLANISTNDQLGKNQGNQPRETTSTNDQVSKELFKQKPTDKLDKFKPPGSQTENKSNISEEALPQSEEVSNTKPTEDIPPAQASSAEHRAQYNPFLHRKPPNHAPQPSASTIALDKEIRLKNGQKRDHIHRYDIKLSVIKPKEGTDEFKVIKTALQKFFDLLLQADSSIIIPPFYELEREDKKAVELSKNFPVSELDCLISARRYFARLSKITEQGFIYCNVIVAHTKSFMEIMDKTRQILNDLKYGFYPRASDHEDSAEVGWLLYSTKYQDSERLSEMFSSLTQEKVGVKWKAIRTNDRFRKETNNDSPTEVTFAMHLESAANKAPLIRSKLAKWYSTTSRSFPDGTKLRLVPPYQSLTAFSHKTKYSALVARQAAISARIGSASCYDFAANMILDRSAPDTKQTLRQYLLSIPSVNFPSTPMFHTVDKTFRSTSGVTFSFHPENATHAHAIIAGLLCYVREYANPWFMRFFSEPIRIQHETSKWNPDSFEVDTAEGLELSSMLEADGEWNLLEPDFSQVKETNHLNPSGPPKASETYASLYKDSDSVSTFRPVTPSDQSVQPSSTFIPRVVSSVPRGEATQVSDSLSRMSDMDSRMSSLEDRLQSFHTGLQELKKHTQKEAEENAKSLQKIISMLLTGQGGTYPASPPGHSSLAGHQANPLDQQYPAGGSTPRAAGHGS